MSKEPFILIALFFIVMLPAFYFLNSNLIVYFLYLIWFELLILLYLNVIIIIYLHKLIRIKGEIK